MRHVLAENINAKFGNKRGNISAAARKFGITPEHMGMLIKGTRNPSFDLSNAMTAFFKVQQSKLFSNADEVSPNA